MCVSEIPITIMWLWGTEAAAATRRSLRGRRVVTGPLRVVGLHRDLKSAVRYGAIPNVLREFAVAPFNVDGFTRTSHTKSLVDYSGFGAAGRVRPNFNGWWAI